MIVIVHKMDYNNYSNSNSYPSKKPRTFGTSSKLILFCFLTPFVVIGVFLVLLAVGVFDFIPEDPTSKIFLGIFAGFWNFIILFILFIAFIMNSFEKKNLKTNNSYESSQPFQSYPNQINQKTHNQGYFKAQSIRMNFGKSKLITLCFLTPFIVVGVFLILLAVGFFDFIPEDPTFKIFIGVFAGFWNFFIFIFLILILNPSKMVQPPSDETDYDSEVDTFGGFS